MGRHSFLSICRRACEVRVAGKLAGAEALAHPSSHNVANVQYILEGWLSKKCAEVEVLELQCLAAEAERSCAHPVY